MRLSFKNEGFYSKESENSLFASDADLNQNITQIFMMDLDQLCKDDNLEYSNYNLAIDTIVQTSTTNTENYLYGLKDIEYFEKNGIQLEDCYANELVEGTVILPIRAKQEGIKIGDVYTIVDPFNQNSKNVELQVIGFYEDNRWALSSEDTVIKTSPAIVRNSTIFSLLEKYPYYYGMYDEKTGMVVSPIEIVNITFSAKNIEGYSRFVEKFNAFSLEENRKFSQITSEGGAQAKLGLQTNVSEFGSLLKSIQRIRYIYEFIFLGIWILSVVSLFAMTSFMQKKNAHDIGVRKALGERKRTTLHFYIDMYFIVSLVWIVIGTGLGYIVSSILEKQIYGDMFQIHAQMNTLTGQSLKTIQPNIFVEPRNIFACGIFSIIGILLMICLSVVFTTLRIRKLNIRKQMRGAVYE